MAQSSIQKQVAKLKDLSQKIKEEKNKIEQRLGKEIINQADLDYADLSNDRIKILAKKIADLLKENQSTNQL
ncbi:hypothetical protein ACKP2L_00530 (plasmid) [Oenococcus alcoholitolerans]|uniref:Uncharacterized protein n=1 Tax=Oenococcus alcoholitolerans TaxID=931074 RepID=A0ABR4XTB2_9LACO|nr:hypothetical protein Q757_01430 [Oenococcus alcoholitolerans]